MEVLLVQQENRLDSRTTLPMHRGPRLVSYVVELGITFIGGPGISSLGRSVRTPSAGRKVLDRTKAYLRNELYFNTFASLDEPFLSEVAAGIGYHQPKVIYGYGSSLAALGRYLFERSPLVAPSKERLLVQYTADHLGAADSKILEESLGSMVVSDYGASEAPGIAFECPEGHLHISVDCYKIEFLDQEGNEVPEGKLVIS